MTGIDTAMRTPRTLAKGVLRTIAPRLYWEISTRRSQQLIMRRERDIGAVDTSRWFIERYGRTVRGGPFEGMRYPDFTSTRNLVPKLLGAYEEECHAAIERLLATDYACIVNVGSADGYYGVGLAMRKPATPVIAFDTDRWARKATTLMAAANQASNLEMRSLCTPQWCREMPPSSLMIVDVEGFEDQLLDPAAAPRLLDCDIFVETHDWVAKGIEQRLVERFGRTHAIETIGVRPRDPANYPELTRLEPQKARNALFEGRPAYQTWLVITRNPAVA